MTGTHLDGNTSGKDGGGILLGGTGTFTFADLGVTNNSADEHGGGFGIGISLATGTVSLTEMTLTGNTANADSVGTAMGGAIFSGGGASTTIDLSRITGNSATTGTGIANDSGTVMAEDNWWGCDAFPGTPLCDDTSGAVDSDPRVDLPLSAVPGAVPVAGCRPLQQTSP